MSDKNECRKLHQSMKNVCTALLLCTSSMANAGLFFSEYIEGSSNNKALEIYNNTGVDVDLSPYAVEMYFNGSTNAGLVIGLQGILADGDVYVLAQSAATPEILMLADQTNGAGWFNGDDAVVLSTGGSPVDVIGQIGVDPGSQWGSGDLATANRTLRRNSAITTGNSVSTDNFDPATEWQGFAQDTFTGLGNHNGSGNTDPEPPTPPAGACGDAATKIHAIQGDGASTSLAGTNTIEGVVVGDFQGSGRLNGFFLQEEQSDQDNNAATSEGIFIFQGSDTTAIAVGDIVRVSGGISEYFGMTQISATSISICGHNHTVTPISLTLPIPDPTALEALEGMLVHFPQTLTVTENYNLGRYGELVLSAEGRLYNPTQIAEPGIAAQSVAATNRLRRILLDDGSTRQNPEPIAYPAPALSANNTVRTGDEVQQLQGILHYAFDAFRIQPVAEPEFIAVTMRSTAPPTDNADRLKVASFNVLNYFNGDGLGGGFPTSRGASSPQEFTKQRTKIIAALAAMDADIVGLIEIENDGYGPQSAINDLIDGLAGAGLHYALINPGLAQLGTDEITVGIIYKPASVSLVNKPAILDSSVDPEFVDTKNRPVLAQTFRENASQAVITVAVAHLKSKGSDCNDIEDFDTGDGQGNCNQTRTRAASATANWLAGDPTNSGDDDVLLVGDLNAYAKEDPVTTLLSAGFTNLLHKFHGEHAYSYVFDGQAGYLDHALASTSLDAQVTGATEWHINADEPRALDYNEEFKSPAQIVDLYSGAAWRASDHDPLLIELALVGVNIVPGDFNQDQVLTTLDLALLLCGFGTVDGQNQIYDLNQDGKVNVKDALLWVKWHLENQRTKHS